MIAPVAALCCSKRTAYRTIAGVEVYDAERDALTFTGGMRIVAHPPCRAWSAFCAHQAKPAPGERELGLWCIEQVRREGGVLEQPAHSRLWAAGKLPRPGDTARGDWWAAEVWQAWWGYPMRKATWLLFSKISTLDVHYPFVLHPQGGDRRREQLMGKQQRSHTVPAFAEWLVETARKAQ